MFKWLFKKKGCAKHMNNKQDMEANITEGKERQEHE